MKENVKTALEPINRNSFEEAFMTLMSNTEYVQYSFYSFVIAKMQISINRSIPTAGAGFFDNNYQLIINDQFFDTLPVKQRVGVLIHEAMHIILQHIFRKGERDHKLYNVAADIALNQSIKKDMLPDSALYPETFKFPENKTAEIYYELLKKEKEKQEQEKNEWEEDNPEQGDCDNPGQGEGEGEGEQSSKGQGQGEGEPGEGQSRWPGPKNGNPDLTGQEELTIDCHEQWGSGDDSEELAKEMMSGILEDAMEKSRGNMPGDMENILKMWKRQPKISWKKVLKRFVSSKKGSKVGTIKRRDRRQPGRIELKGQKTSYDTPIVVVGIDTSGSMSDEEIVNGLIEINEVCKVSGSDLKVAQIDTQVKEMVDYNPKKKTFKRKGYGGTEMAAMARYLKKEKIKYDVLVMISDMYIEDLTTDKDWAKMKKPTLWLNTSGTDIKMPRRHVMYDISKA